MRGREGRREDWSWEWMEGNGRGEREGEREEISILHCRWH